MRKKLALFGGSLTLLVGTFAGLCYLADVNPFHTRALPAPRPAEASASSDAIPLEYEARDPSGTLEYVLTARQAIPQGQGKYKLDHPKATYYLRNDQLVVMSADTGSVRVDQMATGTEKLRVVGGSLSDNVKLTVGPTQTFTSADDTTRQPGQIQAAFAAPIQFDYDDRTIESHGPIQVRSDQVNFDGANLMLTLNMDARRIEFLRVEPQKGGGKIVLKDVGKGELAMGGNTQPAPTPAPANDGGGGAAVPQAPAPAPAGDANSASKNELSKATYRLTFGHDVHATLGSVALTAEQLAVLFQTAAPQGSARPADKPVATGGQATVVQPAAANGAAGQPAAASGAASQPAPSGQDLVLTWTGPMEMRPVADPQAQKLAAAGIAFEATGSAQHPVLVKTTDGGSAKAGVLRYTRSDETITLLPGALPEVVLARGAPDPVEIDAPAASYNQKTHALTFFGGPGHLEAPALADNGKARQPFHADWQDKLEVELLQGATAQGDQPGATPKLALRRAVFTGMAHLWDPTFALGANVVDLTLAPQTAAQKRVALEHLVAAGHVQIASYLQGRPKDKANTLEADRLEVASAKDAAGQVVPQVVWAAGHVVGVNYDQVKGQPGELAEQKITGPNLRVELASKRGGSAGGSGGSAGGSGGNDSTGLGGGAGGGLGGFKPERLTATGGVSVELGGMGPEPVVATADSLDALVSTGTARLTGQGAGRSAQPARLKQGANQIAGQSILLDRDAQTIQIPGPGDFVFEQAPEAGGKPTPVKIAWAQRMDYSGKTGDALFAGPVTVSLLGNPLQESSLTADMLYASGLPANGLGTGSGAKGASQPKARTQAKIRAEGHVVAQGKTFDAQHHLETQMLLDKVDVAIYDGPQQTLLVPGPGEVYFADLRPEPGPRSGAKPAGEAFSARGTQAMSWNRRLLYDAGTHQMEAQGDVLLVVKPTTPATVPLPVSGGATQKQKVERITLRAQDLTALVMPKRSTASANPMAMGANQSGLELKSVTASSNATLILNDGSASVQSEQLSYDRLTGKVTAGGPDQTVRYVLADGGQGRAESVLWDIPSGSFTIRGSQGRFDVPAEGGNVRP